MSSTSPISSHRHNLPAPISSFIGRKGELEEIARLLRQHRLVTLTGVGGAGKTRLALHTSRLKWTGFAMASGWSSLPG